MCGDEAKSAPQVHFLLSELFKVNKSVTTKLLQRIEWKVVVEFPEELFITPGKRWANRTERAYFNVLRNMNSKVWSGERLSAKVTSDIGEVSKFFQKDGKLELTDIWARITRKVSGLQEINRQIIFLGGHEISVIVTHGLQNAALIVGLLGQYCISSFGKKANLLHLELADAGLVRAALFARQHGSWTIGLEEIVHACFDWESNARAPLSGGVIAEKRGDKVNNYLFGRPYPIELDSYLVEWKVTGEWKNRFLNVGNLHAASNLYSHYKRSFPTLRVPFIISMASLSLGLPAGKSAPKQVSEEDKSLRSEFIREVKHLAHKVNQRTKGNPSEQPEDGSFFDATVQYAAFSADIDLAGPCRYNSCYDFLTFGSDIFKFGCEKALIVSAILGTFEEDDGCHPVVYTLAFANCHGRILFVCSGPKPDGIEEKEYLTFGNREEPTYMRQMLLYYLGTTNVLVGFHLGWLLAALNLALPAHRVVELGEEPAFQMYVKNIASSTYPREFFKVKQSPSFDRRWPAILSGYLFNFGSTAESVLRECFYIAALWQLLHQPIVDRRNNVAVYRLKCAYVVGVGCDVREDEFKWIDDSLDHPHTICLTNMKIKETGARKGEERSVISNSLDCTEERWLEFLNETMAANVIAVIADGKDIREQFRISCVRLSLQRNVVDNIEWLDPFLE